MGGRPTLSAYAARLPRCLRCDRPDPDLERVFAGHVGRGRLLSIDDPTGDDQLSGLGVTAAIVQEGMSFLEHAGVLALEVDERRASLVAEMVMSAGGYTNVSVVLDLTGRERFVFASRA